MLPVSIKKEMNKTGKCPCAICKNPDILVIHHIEGREIHKANHPSNLCSICSSCHAKVHYGFIIIEKWVTTTGGKELFWHNKGEPSFTGEDSHPPLLI
jgi:CRISPR/Cas system-associated protein Cas10 (large subunit of type III CRISPR-Cas system)